MNNEEKKQYLCRYQQAKRRAALLMAQMEELRSSKTSPAVSWDRMPRGNRVSDLSGYAARLDGLLRELEAEREMQMIVYREIYERVKELPDPIEQEILTRRYLLGQNWEKIAEEMYYSYRHVTKLHGQALDHFAIA